MLKLLTVKRILTFILFTFGLENLWADELPSNRQIITASWHQIKSKVLGETRHYSVYLPLSYHREPTKNYPVLYVTDGHETRMKGIAGMVESLAHHELSRQIPELIVVAIPSDNRSYDLTPTKTDLAFKGQVLQEMKNNSGGAKDFAKFIQEELVETVDSAFRTSHSRGIAGMSFGGLIVADILLTNPDSFSHYLIVDATFVWDNNYLNDSLRESTQVLSEANANVFIGLANNDHLGDLGITNRKWGNDFINNLNLINNKQLLVSSKYFPNEQHGTVMFLAFYYGLLQLYSNSST